MKTFRLLLFCGLWGVIASSCSVFSKPKYGCGDNGGRNVGAEKILDGTASKKSKKFKA